MPVGYRIQDTYEVVRLAAQGGMALLYQIRRLCDGGLYALKVLIHHAPKGARYFHDEAQLMRDLRHPNVPAVVDMGIVESHPFIIMEWLEGETLADRLAREGSLQLDAVIEICRQIGEVLVAVHPRGIVHRDLKPANIFMCQRLPKGSDLDRPPYFVKVLDFGIARVPAPGRPATAPGTILGTPEYMAPEQARGDVGAIDARSDQYSLAMIAYTMLRGSPAFALKDAAKYDELLVHLYAVQTFPPPPLPSSVPVAVEHVLLRALSKIPADRYRAVKDFIEALVTAQQVGANASTLRSRTQAATVGRSADAALPANASPPVSIVVEGRYAVKGMTADAATKLTGEHAAAPPESGSKQALAQDAAGATNRTNGDKPGDKPVHPVPGAPTGRTSRLLASGAVTVLLSSVLLGHCRRPQMPVQATSSLDVAPAVADGRVSIADLQVPMDFGADPDLPAGQGSSAQDLAVAMDLESPSRDMLKSAVLPSNCFSVDIVIQEDNAQNQEPQAAQTRKALIAQCIRGLTASITAPVELMRTEILYVTSGLGLRDKKALQECLQLKFRTELPPKAVRMRRVLLNTPECTLR